MNDKKKQYWKYLNIYTIERIFHSIIYFIIYIYIGYTLYVTIQIVFWIFNWIFKGFLTVILQTEYKYYIRFFTLCRYIIDIIIRIYILSYEEYMSCSFVQKIPSILFFIKFGHDVINKTYTGRIDYTSYYIL